MSTAMAIMAVGAPSKFDTLALGHLSLYLPTCRIRIREIFPRASDSNHMQMVKHYRLIRKTHRKGSSKSCQF